MVQPGQVEVEVDTFAERKLRLYSRGYSAVWSEILIPASFIFSETTTTGLRARALGVRIWLMARNHRRLSAQRALDSSWRSPGIGIRERWARVKHPARGAPWTYWARFVPSATAARFGSSLRALGVSAADLADGSACGARRQVFHSAPSGGMAQVQGA